MNPYQPPSAPSAPDRTHPGFELLMPSLKSLVIPGILILTAIIVPQVAFASSSDVSANSGIYIGAIIGGPIAMVRRRRQILSSSWVTSGIARLGGMATASIGKRRMGDLFLTPDKLVFVARGVFGTLRDESSIPLEDIVSVTPRRWLLNKCRGLRIETRTHGQWAIWANQAPRWISAIETFRSAAPAQQAQPAYAP